MKRSYELVALAVACVAGLPASSASAVEHEVSGLDVPAAVAGPSSRLQGVMARQLFGQLPPDQQQRLTRMGAPGSQPQIDVGVGVLRLDPESSYASVAHLVSPEVYAQMTPGQVIMLKEISENTNPDWTPPMVCWAPGTAPDVMNAINSALESKLQIRFQQTSRWSATATNGGTGGQGTPITLTYSFVPDGTFVPNLGIGLGSGNSQLFQWLNGIYGSFANWKPLFDGVFERWGELINVTYVYEPNDDGSNTNTLGGQLGVRGDVRIAAFDFQNDGNFGTLGYNNFPNDGDMILDAFDSFYNATGANSLRLRNVIAHEHGHGLGMLHVCPQNATKLMEPAANLNFDGPQLDDILNGQRHYGDLNEPNDSGAQATDIGTLAVGQTKFEFQRSIDDNGDEDYYAVNIDGPVEINVSLSPAAAAYSQGPQTFSCGGGNFTDYQSIHDLRVDFIDADGTTVLASFNNNPEGETESASFDAQTAGTYFIRVRGDSTNNIQLYTMTVQGSNVSFLTPLIDVVGGVPENVDPGVDTSFTVTIDPQQDTLVAGSAKFFYSLDGGPFVEQVMADLGGNTFEATLPAAACGQMPEFYVSVESVQTGETFEPPLGPSEPFSLSVGDLVVRLTDDFETDTGWTVSGPATGANAGRWERGVPLDPGSVGAPTEDFDGSGSAYVTGNTQGNSDVDNSTVLTSPTIDFAGQPEAEISYARWFDDVDSVSPGGGLFLIEISNDGGSTWTFVEVLSDFISPADADGGWIPRTIRVADFVTPTSQTVMRFTVNDNSGSSVVEAGIDAFDARAGECIEPDDCPADLAAPFGQLDFFDVLEYLALFDASDPAADLAAPFGAFDFFDVLEYLGQFDAGCD
ncbi:MAG: GC-type dockerin domain-anchored protein [Planctomycetota bacterium]